MTTEMQYQRIDKATLTATELSCDLRDAYANAEPIEAMVLLPLVKQANEIQQRLAELRAAHCNEGIK